MGKKKMKDEKKEESRGSGIQGTVVRRPSSRAVIPVVLKNS